MEVKVVEIGKEDSFNATPEIVIGAIMYFETIGTWPDGWHYASGIVVKSVHESRPVGSSMILHQFKYEVVS